MTSHQSRAGLVSVIIPVYNAEQHLHCCISSVLAQTVPHFELILVDDGSKDNSGRICDEYASQDPRVRVIHIPNGGVSNARNTGLDHAQGEFVVFIDSDDWVSPEYIESLIPTDGEDLVAGGYVCVTKNTVTSTVAHKPHTTNQKQWQEDFSCWWASGPLMHPWGHCYRRSVIEANHIRFDSSFSIAEDELFNLTYIFHCNTVRYTDACHYNYRCEVETSLTHRHHPNRTKSGIAVVQAMERVSQKNEYKLRWYEWKSVIAHHRKYKKLSKTAKRCLSSCYRDPYFRHALPYIRKHGSLDEKIESYFMFAWAHPLFPPLYKLVENIYRLLKS